MTEVNADTVRHMWVLTLVLYAVVLVVVAGLLVSILRAARLVRAGVSSIWTVGQQVANNTIHIALLDATNHVAGEILASARNIAGATSRVAAHAAACRGCPACVIGGGR